MAQVEEKPGVATATLKNPSEAAGSRPRVSRRSTSPTRRAASCSESCPLRRVPGGRGRPGCAEAFPGWRATPPVERARACFELKYRLEAALDELALLVTRDNGKAIKDAAGEVRAESSASRWPRASLARGARTSRTSRVGSTRTYGRQPIGVFAAVTPFNFRSWCPCGSCRSPSRAGTRSSASRRSRPLTVQKTFELLDGVVPPGVVNLVHGGKLAVDAILEHPGIDGVSFVGSTPVAHYIYETAAKHGKRVQALGGAKNHVIVMPDAELDSAADGVSLRLPRGRAALPGELVASPSENATSR